MAVMERSETQNGTSSLDQIAVKNPITSEEIGKIPITSADEVRAAAGRARAAQPAWEGRGVKERAALLRAWADLLWDDQKQAMQKIRSETGKNEIGSWLEVVVIDTVVAYYHHNAPRLL